MRNSKARAPWACLSLVAWRERMASTVSPTLATMRPNAKGLQIDPGKTSASMGIHSGVSMANSIAMSRMRDSMRRALVIEHHGVLSRAQEVGQRARMHGKEAIKETDPSGDGIAIRGPRLRLMPLMHDLPRRSLARPPALAVAVHLAPDWARGPRPWPACTYVKVRR